jgi:hypothetical protein
VHRIGSADRLAADTEYGSPCPLIGSIRSTVPCKAITRTARLAGQSRKAQRGDRCGGCEAAGRVAGETAGYPPAAGHPVRYRAHISEVWAGQIADQVSQERDIAWAPAGHCQLSAELGVTRHASQTAVRTPMMHGNLILATADY